MSQEMTTLALESALPRNLKAVFWGIANHTNPDGQGCWASYDRLCYYTDYEERQVIRLVQQLEDMGIISFQGYHPQFGTNMWMINIDKVPLKPKFKVWQQEQRQKKRAAKLAAKETAPAEEGMSKCHPPSGDILGDSLRVTFAPENVLEMSSEPSYNTENLLNQTPAKFAGNDAAPPDEFDVKIPINEQESIDDQYSRGNDEIDNRRLPKTALERLIVEHSVKGTKYIEDAQRSSLNLKNRVIKKGELERLYPSCEHEYKKNPERFAAYVYACSQISWNTYGKPPSRGKLIDLIRNYGRMSTGWLDFENMQDKKAAPTKQAEGKYYENRPKRPVFGEKPRL